MYDLQGSIVFFLNGDARLGFELLKCDTFRGKSQSVFLLSQIMPDKKTTLGGFHFSACKIRLNSASSCSILFRFSTNPFSPFGLCLFGVIDCALEIELGENISLANPDFSLCLIVKSINLKVEFKDTLLFTAKLSSNICKTNL